MLALRKVVIESVREKTFAIWKREVGDAGKKVGMRESEDARLLLSYSNLLSGIHNDHMISKYKVKVQFIWAINLKSLLKFSCAYKMGNKSLKSFYFIIFNNNSRLCFTRLFLSDDFDYINIEGENLL